MALFKVKPWYKKKNKVSYYGSLNFSTAHDYPASADLVGSFACFYGGYGSSSSGISTFEGYNSSLTRSYNAGSYSAWACTGASYYNPSQSSNYVAFAGGYSSGYPVNRMFYVYGDFSVGQGTSLAEARAYIATASLKDYVAFIFGHTSSSTYSSTIDYYNSSRTHSSGDGGYSSKRGWCGAASVKDNIIINTGLENNSTTKNPVQTVLALDSSKTISTLMNNPTPRYGHTYSSVSIDDKYALFCGGNKQGQVASDLVDVFSSSLTYIPNIHLSNAIDFCSAAAVNTSSTHCAVVYTPGSAVIDVYDASLTHSTAPAKTYDAALEGRGASVINNYVLFAGGEYPNGTKVDNIDVYQVS